MQQIKGALGVALVAAWLLAACGTPNPPTTGTSPDPAATSPPIATNTATEETTVVTGVDEPPSDEGQAVVTSGSCAELYSPETLARRGIAFDGTVTAVELRDDSVMGGKMPWVTFKVNHWYRGGEGDTYSMWAYISPIAGEDGTIMMYSDGVRASAGTRLLVAGEQRDAGPHPEEGIAWSCGFTQPYSPEAAAEWEAALGKSAP